MTQVDLFVIGGGSAGLKAARTAAKLGASVGLAEEVELGGECHWAGCIPTKAMVRAAEVWHTVRRAHEFGVDTSGACGSFDGAMAYKHRALMQSSSGPPDAGLGKIGVRYWNDHAELLDGRTIRTSGETVRFDKLIVATGTEPWIPPIPGLREAGFITNREAVNLDKLPARLAVLGGGPIGIELAQVFRRFGAQVTIIERSSRILPSEDHEIAAIAERRLRGEGIDILKDTTIERVDGRPSYKELYLTGPGSTMTLPIDEILVATGRQIASAGLGIEATGVDSGERSIIVDDLLRTNVPHIWCAGDANGGYLFTHVASYEGRIAAENAVIGNAKPVDIRVVPRATFMDPEIASVGMTEEQADRSGIAVSVHRFDFADLDRAILHGDADGLVKIVAERGTGLILGAHIIGPHASSLIAELALAMKYDLPVSAIAETIHAFPTFPEAIEAAASSPAS